MGFLFYFLVFLAALSSSISILEVCTAYSVDKNLAAGKGGKDGGRKKATVIFALAIFVFGLLVALDGLGSGVAGGAVMVDDLKACAEEKYTDAEFEAKRAQYDFARPFTKESLLYRELFEKYYPGQARMVKDFWMPNKSWAGCDVNDPSARVLANYGASGV